MGFEFGQIQVESVKFVTSMALWIGASYLALLICEMRGGALYHMQSGRNERGSPCRALSSGAWCVVPMGVGAMEMTSTALGGGSTNEKKYVPQTPRSSGTEVLGVGGT